ncbi:pro-sigmaK processing inhibitor BofA family protein [Paratissierella segnis]|uniref:Pro-sigmaK processing inhibitor BofA family protein n=1 Tax=Paratissierella segnis TaxID=2763679 RepID=A0A926ERN5_9FIRM|nr:pro-sigmaK processing inhibitor BofA family protein [Paratissierella segnis]MBC8587270.1 pro-sigmaK processing inhibitor BofA family protein [Paratissierella segnis]
MGVNLYTIGAFLLGLVLLYIVGMLLVIPIKLLIKLLINGFIGGVILFFFNLIGGIFSLSIAINPLNALIVGILGVPGVVLLLIAQMIL